MPLDVAALCAFAWDFADKGMDATLARVRDLGVTHLYLAVSYHAGYFLYPHNPVRRVHLLEDGVVYFRPQPEFYRDTPLKPLAAAMCAGRDWLAAIGERLDGYGLRLGAWTVCLHNTRLGVLHPDCAVRNALGDVYPHALCPSDARVQAYVLGMARELVGRYPVDMLMLEATTYRGRKHGADWVNGHHHERDGTLLAPPEQALFDISFTPSDLAAATAEGIDGEAVRQAVAAHLLDCLAAWPDRPAGRAASLAEFEAQVPALAAYRACLNRQVEQLAAAVHAETSRAGVALVGSGAAAFDWTLASGYGKTPGEVMATVREAKAAAPPHQKILLGIRFGFNPPAMGAVHSQTQLERCVRAAEEGGAAGTLLYNLAESPGRDLGWMKPALRRGAPLSVAPLRLGLVGCGGIGEAYLRAARRLADVEIVAVADSDVAQARRRAAEFGIATAVESADALLRDAQVDALIVATPPDTHAALFQAGLAAGRPVLVEKPLAPTLAGADAMVAAAHAAGRIVGVPLVHRYLMFYRVLRDLVRAGALGQVRQIRVRTGRDIYPDARFRAPQETRGGWLTRPDVAGGGILMSSTIHLFSVCAFLLDGAPVVRVEAQTRRLHPRAYDGIEDDVTALAWTDGGVEMQVEDSWAREWPFELEVWGDEGRVRATGATWNGSVVLSGVLRGPLPPEYRELGGASGFTVNAARFDHLCLPLFDGLLADFAASIRANAPAPDLPGILHARNMQAVVAACYEAARQRMSVPVAWRAP